MEPVKIGVASVQDRQGGRRGAPRRRKKKKWRPDGAAEAETLVPAPGTDPEVEDEADEWPEGPFVGRHLNIVA